MGCVKRSGLTLVEMLVGMAITLVMMAAVVTLFANVSSGVRNRRAAVELSGQLRHTRNRLARDLAGATCPANTWQRPEAAVGYLEIIDGIASDSNPSALIANNLLDRTTSLVPSSNLQLPAGDVTDGGGLGDFDCILALTVKSDGEPFSGRYGTVETIKSQYAEVIWFAVENPADGSLGEPGLRTLYRRMLLIAPWVDLPNLDDLPGVSDEEKVVSYYRNYDISAQMYQVQPNGNLILNMSGNLIPNTLADLTKRENRFGHRLQLDGSLGWPYLLDQRAIRLLPFNYDTVGNLPFADSSPLRPFGAPFEPDSRTWVPAEPDRTGEDLMLSDVLAFDIRVYDPGAPYFTSGLNSSGQPVNALEPVDPGWGGPGGSVGPIGYGAYVNIGWGDFDVTIDTDDYSPLAAAPTPLFHLARQPGWHPRLPLLNKGYPAAYDTWSFHYEHDGLNQDAASGVDQGTNGLDDDGNSGVDDAGERETSPPYDTPLRGVKIILRAYERDTRQIRETSVTHSFVP
ncbi:prepilin-type N-terminal cleavage/methylation domain-containing protein [Pirellulales bacterium]|nr:prepilin-type N-terminal cleavage/methylation domain-containing protein [Pirellulales bacterium]